MSALQSLAIQDAVFDVIMSEKTHSEEQVHEVMDLCDEVGFDSFDQLLGFVRIMLPAEEN